MQKITLGNRLLSFWPLQAGGWLGYAMVTAISLLPVRQEHGLLESRAVFVCSEFLASFVMYGLCHTLWRRSVALVPSLSLCFAACYVLGIASVLPAVWTELYVQHEPNAQLWKSTFASGVGGAFVLVAWSSLYFGIKHYQTAQDQKLLLLASEATARAAQLRALQYQLQPHFLFNTLNAISSLVVSEQGAMATEMLSKLGALLRSTLEQPDVYSISLDQELAVVEEYLEIEKVRFASRLTVIREIQWEAQSAIVPRFLLQPIVENAIRHGIARRPQGGALRIRAFLKEKQVCIEVQNDIGEPGLDDVQPSHGLGLSNSRARLEKLYGDGATLTTCVKEQRFVVVMMLPFTPAAPTSFDERRV